MRDAITLFERELARRNGHTMMSGSSRFVEMMERDLESIYDLLPATPENTMAEPHKLYGPRVSVIVQKTSDCYTRELDNSGSLSGVVEEPWIIHILQLI
jgi:hypothetical protein